MIFDGLVIDNERNIRVLTQNKNLGLTCGAIECCLLQDQGVYLEDFYHSLIYKQECHIANNDVVLKYRENNFYVYNDIFNVEHLLPINLEEMMDVVKALKTFNEHHIGQMIGVKRSRFHTEAIHIHYGWCAENALRITALNAYSLLLVDFVESSFYFLKVELGLNHFFDKIDQLNNDEILDCGEYFKVLKINHHVVLFRKDSVFELHYARFVYNSHIYKIDEVKKILLNVDNKLSQFEGCYLA